ncbi:MAG: ABC transporter ATP-binding protein [Bacteroidota bacterium]
MKSLKYLNKYFLKYKWHLIAGIVFTVVSNFFAVKMPVLVKDTINHYVETLGNLTFENAIWLAIKTGGIYLALTIAKGIFLFLVRQSIIMMSRQIEYDLKNEIFNQYLKLDFSFYKRNNTGDLMNRISEDVSLVRMYLGPGVMYTINLVVLFVLVIVQMIAINGTLTLFVLIPLPLMSFLIYKVSSSMSRLSSEVQKEQSTLSTLAQETFSGIRIIKAYQREEQIHDKFNSSADNYKNKSMRLIMVNSLFMPTISFLIGLSTVILIYLGGIMTINETITVGDIVAFVFFVNMLTWPFASVGWVTSIIQRAAASQTRINQFLEATPEIKNNNFDDFTFKGKIEFKNVSYTYPNTGIQAIENLSFVVEKGKTFAIIGRTGSGKSTILHLLTRNIQPDSGQILIDGIDISMINLDQFRAQIGIVPQEVFLFSDTISYNISFGLENRNVSIEELREVAKRAHVLHNIEDFPAQFDTLLGERGVNLSGGQKQRISIARALIRKPKLLLLDDCLSAVDTETEEIILRNLVDESIERTTLIVSHRISSLRNADKMILIDKGQKVEEGSHDELIALNGQYAEIYEKQLIDEAEESEESEEAAAE